MGKSFATLYKRLEKTPGYLAERMAVTLLAELNTRMRDLGMSNSDLARAANVSPAYITKLFRGPSNVSLETIAKLALAVECRPHVHLAVEGAQVRWFDVMQRREQAAFKDNAPLAFEEMMKALSTTRPLIEDVSASNDGQFLSNLEFA